MMTAKTTAPCLPPPPAPDRLASVSQQTVKSCGAWLKTLHRPKSSVSFQGGWSRWWRRRSQEGGGSEEAALEVEFLQRRQLWKKTLVDLSTNQTKTAHHRALTVKLRRLLPNLLRTQSLLPVRLCSHSLSGVIPRILHPIFLLTCLCCEIFLYGGGWKLNLAWLLSWENSSIIWVEEGEETSQRKPT